MHLQSYRLISLYPYDCIRQQLKNITFTNFIYEYEYNCVKEFMKTYYYTFYENHVIKLMLLCQLYTHNPVHVPVQIILNISA